MRYPVGYAWNPGLYFDKLLRIWLYPGMTHWVPGYNWGDGFGFAGGNPNQDFFIKSGGWDTVMTSIPGYHGEYDASTEHYKSDGQWHYYEVHLKVASPNGVFQMWIDGIPKVNLTVDFGPDTGVWFLQLHGNGAQRDPAFCGLWGDCYIDIDDIAASTTGYIGPVNEKQDTMPPAAPGGVMVN
jgi:hypothetical protein